MHHAAAARLAPLTFAVPAARDDLRRLQEALAQLPPRCRQAVILRKVEGLSLREISDRMGIAVKTVKAHLNDGVRALADLRFGDEGRGKS